MKNALKNSAERSISKQIKFLVPLMALGLIATTLAVAQSSGQLSAQVTGQVTAQKAGTFTQTKQLIGLSRALKSSGTFTISEAEVLWTTITPLYSEVLISGDAVRERYTPEGEFQVTARGESVTTVSRVLALIVKNDIDGLQRYFDVKQQGNSSQLTPRSDALKELFARIDIEQQATTVNVRIAEASGSSTQIILQPDSSVE